jgi:hypothetical protein
LGGIEHGQGQASTDETLRPTIARVQRDRFALTHLVILTATAA